VGGRGALPPTTCRRQGGAHSALFLEALRPRRLIEVVTCFIKLYTQISPATHPLAIASGAFFFLVHQLAASITAGQEPFLLDKKKPRPVAGE